VRIENCVTVAGVRNCEQKTVVRVPVSYGMETQMEAVTAQEEPVEITVTKTEPRLIYPLTYFHAVPYFPYEEVKRVSNAVVGQMSCIDSPVAQNPSCGWTYQGPERIEDSQGFCCNRDVEEIGLTNQRWRGEEILGEQPTLLSSFSTAHCLRMGDPASSLYYDGYEIGEYSATYEITVKLKKGADEHEFKLTPENPFYNIIHDPGYAGEIKVEAELLGDPDNYVGTPELDNYILYIPAAPDSHPYVQNYQQNMLLVPREETSKDGGELDKVGLSFHSFRTMRGDCRTTEAGDGLHNQLFHKHNADIVKLEANTDAEATYLVHEKKVFKRSMSFVPGMEKFLEHKVMQINNSMVSLMVDADSLKYIEME
jgi:hypothetical protein